MRAERLGGGIGAPTCPAGLAKKCSQRRALDSGFRGRAAVEAHHQIPAAVVGEISAGAEHSVAPGISIRVLEHPDLRMEEQTVTRRTHGMDHGFEQGEKKVGRDAWLEYLSRLGEDVDLVGGAAYRVEDRDGILAVARTVRREGQRHGQRGGQI